MKKTILATLLAAIAGLTVGSLAHAADDQRGAAAKQKWDAMTPDQKAAAKEKAKTKWDAMTPEQKETAKKRFSERHPQAAAKMVEKKKEEAAAAAAK